MNVAMLLPCCHFIFGTLGDTPIEYVYPILGFGIFSFGIYTEFPHCLGCVSRTYFGTSNWEQMTCKPARYPNSTNACCVTNRTNCECVWPPTFFKFIDQVLFLDIRIGIPCDDDAPMLWNLFGYTLCYKNFRWVGKCGQSYKQLEDEFIAVNGGTPGVAPTGGQFEMAVAQPGYGQPAYAQPGQPVFGQPVTVQPGAQKY